MSFAGTLAIAVLCAIFGFAAADDRHHLFVEMIGVRNVKDTDTWNNPDPYAILKVYDQSGKVPWNCMERKTTIRDETKYPTWYSTLLLCRDFEWEKAGDMKLRIEIKDHDGISSDDHCGSLTLPVQQLLRNGDDIQTFKAEKTTYSIRIRTAFPTKTTKRVYLVSNSGKTDAVKLSNSIDAVFNGSRTATSYERGLMQTNSVLAAPGTSAVETAAITLDPMARIGLMTAPFVLAQDLREHGTKGDHTGSSLRDQIMSHMRKEVYRGAVPPSMERNIKNVDLSQVGGRWWSDSEDSKEYAARLNSFLIEQLMWDERDNIVLFSSGDFFRDLVRKQMMTTLQDRITACLVNTTYLADPETCDQYNGYSVKQIQSAVMNKAAAMALQLDFSGAIAKLSYETSEEPTEIISDLSFLFGTGLRGVKGVERSYATAPPEPVTTSPEPVTASPEPVTASPEPTLNPAALHHSFSALSVEPAHAPEQNEVQQSATTKSHNSVPILIMLGMIVVVAVMGFATYKFTRRGHTSSDAAASEGPALNL